MYDEKYHRIEFFKTVHFYSGFLAGGATFWAHPVFGPSLFLQLSTVTVQHWNILVDVGLQLFINIAAILLSSILIYAGPGDEAPLLISADNMTSLDGQFGNITCTAFQSYIYISFTL